MLSHEARHCTGKIRYRSKHQAKKNLKKIVARYGGKPTTLNAYRCCYCGGVHLGHNDGGRKLTEIDLIAAEF